MPVSESDIPTSILPVAAAPEAEGPAAPQATGALQHCDECAAPVGDSQRYCVVCGAHRRHVNDPAARYLSQVTARTRSVRSPVAARGRRTRSLGLGIALALCLIPVAAALGVVVGRSSNNGDAQLIQALARRQAQTGTASAVSSGGATSAGAAAARSSTAHVTRKKATRARHSTTRAHAAVTQTRNGPISQVTGFKATKSQEQQGAAVTQRVQKSTGKAYVNQQSNLPSQVVIP